MSETETYPGVPSRKLTTKAIFVLNLIDSYSQKRPTGKVKVDIHYINKCELKMKKNLSGYYVFQVETVSDDYTFPEQPGVDYTVTVTSQFYFEEVVPVDIPTPNPGCLVKEVNLKPLPSYPFPPHTTLIRGMVHDSGGNPASGAKVEIAARSMSTKTT